MLTEFQQLRAETAREEFRYVVPDFRLNKAFGELDSLTQEQKDKVGISLQRVPLGRMPGQKALL